MAKDKDKDKDKKKERDPARPAKQAKAHAAAAQADPPAQAAGGAHHEPARAHGRPVKVDESLPATRAELLTLHADARRRRNTAALGGKDFRNAIGDLERIEVRIAAIDRAAEPPAG